MKLIKKVSPDFKGLELPKNDFINDALIKVNKDLINQLENYIIEGLKRKGFEFKTKFELEKFVKDNCICEDNVNLEERVYYVNDTPFFLHRYKSVIDIEQLVEDRKITMSANCGTYAYL